MDVPRLSQDINDHQITNGLEIDQENAGQIGNPIIRCPKGRHWVQQDSEDLWRP